MKNVVISILVFVVVAIPAMYLIVLAWMTLSPPSLKPEWQQIVPGQILGICVGLYAAKRCYRWLQSI